MFIQNLEKEDRKFFLELANYIVKVDGNIAEKEVMMLNLFRKEGELIDYNFSNLELDEIINYFKDKAMAIKKSVFFEATSIILVDEEIHIREKETLDKLKMELNLTNEDEINAVRIISDLTNAYVEAHKFIR